MDHEEFNQAAPWEPGSQTIWKYHLIEVLVFLFLIVPSMAFSFAAKATMGAMGFTSLAGALIIQDLSLLTLVLYFIWRNGEHLRDLGWTWKNRWSDVFLGLILFVPFTYVAKILENVLHHAGLTAPSGHSAALTAHGAGEIALGVVLVIVVAVAEETIFRGYLMLRFQGAHLGPLIAALLSALIFSLGHGYEGTAGVITVIYMGLTFALIYLWRGSLVVPVVLHFLQDFIGIVVPALIR
jgi:membrane protease YdiL (CAAX protease family)